MSKTGSRILGGKGDLSLTCLSPSPHAKAVLKAFTALKSHRQRLSQTLHRNVTALQSVRHLFATSRSQGRFEIFEEVTRVSQIRFRAKLARFCVCCSSLRRTPTSGRGQYANRSGD